MTLHLRFAIYIIMCALGLPLGAHALCHAADADSPSANTATIHGDSTLVNITAPGTDFTESILGTDTLAVATDFNPLDRYDYWEQREVTFNPQPTRAVWLAALCPGLGQVYNRRYWKLPIVAGAFAGLGYATAWNNKMLTDYQRAYLDIMDVDPTTNSYLNFFPPNTNEDDLDKKWLTSLLQSRKNFYRRNRDLCIIGMIGVYLVAIVDAYVDASLSHFDVSPDLSIDLTPTLIPDSRNLLPGIGLSWALNF